MVKFDKETRVLTAEITALSHDGRGIATIDNKVTFIDGALPKEVVTCKLTHKKTKFNQAKLVNIVNASPLRQTPPCRHYGICGGCNLQHMSIDAQIFHKQQVLLEQLNYIGRVTPEAIFPPLNANSLGYRRKARLGVKYVPQKNKVLVGFREKASRYLADLSTCAVLHPKISNLLPALSELIYTLSKPDKIPQIEVAVGDDHSALIFRHLELLSALDEEKLTAFAIDHQIHVYLQPNSKTLLNKLWPKDDNCRLTYHLSNFNITFDFHPLDFTQINFELNQLLVKKALTYLELEKEDKVLDLFCGLGNFTLPIAQQVKQVTGVEGSLEMTARALENAKKNGMTNVEFHTANLMQPDPNAPWMQATYDKILLDPPRLGAKEILAYFNQFAAKQIVYISCNTATFARDAGELVHRYGYTLKHVGVMNMFPHTAHIEIIAVFTHH